MSGVPTIEDVVRAVRGGDPTADERVLRRAYRIAERVHLGQVRYSGEPYLTHPVSVALLLAEWGADDRTVAAALLHDVPIQWWRLIRRGHVAAAVGRSVLRMLDELDAVSGDPDPAMPRLHARAAAGDPRLDRVLLLKVADRLHNARTWDHVPDVNARARAEETRSSLVGIARQAGLPAVAVELAALADRTLARRPTQDGPRPCMDGAVTGSGGVVGDGRDVGGDVVTRALRQALLVLPAIERSRYEREWAADLAATHGHRQRLLLVLGMLYSARALRRDHASSEQVFPRPTR